MTKVDFDFGQSLGVDAVEELLATGESERAAEVEWVLDLSQCRHVDAGAASRLSNAMALWSRGRLVVKVPDPGDFAEAWFRLFTRTGLGLALATYANDICTSDTSIREQVADYYAKHGDESSINYAIELGLESGRLVPSIARFAASFNDQLREWLPGANRLLPAEERVELIQLSFEAILNVLDHAYQLPWQGADRALSAFSMRWYKGVSAAPTSTSNVSRHIGERRHNLSAGQSIAGWLEVIIQDDGIGLAARHSLDPEIYSRPVEAEREALNAAFTPGGTVKPKAGDAVLRGDPGHGTQLIANGLAELSAYAVLRSGRLAVELDAAHGTGSFEIQDTVLGYVPGTMLQVLIGLIDPQLQFEVAT